MGRKNLAFMAASILVFALAGNVQAGLTRVVFDVFTTNYTNAAQQQINFWIPVYDNQNHYGPDFVSSITITAPGGRTFSVHPKKDWLPYDRAYWKALYSNPDFQGNPIPAGTYTVTVVPLVANTGLTIAQSTISETDSVTAAFLPTPVVSSPAPGATGLGQSPNLIWGAVTGATYYRVQLWNDSWNEPVYWTWDKQARTDFTRFRIPAGELKPNCQYKFRIEARSNSQDVDMRSRSDWFTFTTGNW